MVKAPDPEEIARRARDDAFQAFRRDNERIMLRVAELIFGGKVVRNGHDPQEAVDKAFEQFERKNFMQKIALEKRSAMLRAIVTARAMDMVKYDKQTEELSAGDHDRHLGVDDPGFERVDDVDEARSEMGRVSDVLAKLTPNQREALERRFVDGESTTVIAEALGLSPRRVRQLLDEALSRLRRRLGASAMQRDGTRASRDETEGVK